MDRDEQKKVLDKINQLNAFKKAAATNEGQTLIRFIFKQSELNTDPHGSSKNSGQTSYTLGKQSVGRALLKKLIQSDVQIDGDIFTTGKPGEIERLENKLNQSLQGENYE
jgi:hypothetical protein